MHQKLIYFLLFSVAVIRCSESSIKNEPLKDTVKKSSPVQKIDSLSHKNICIDFQVGFDKEQIKIYIDDSLILKLFYETFSGISIKKSMAHFDVADWLSLLFSSAGKNLAL